MKQNSYEMIVRAYSADLFRFAYWMCRNRWQAQDLVQETFAAAWRARDSLREESAAKAWLFSILRNEHALGSALELAENVLLQTGISSWEARNTISTFRAHDEQTMVRQHAVYHDESQLIQTSREAAQELQDIMESDGETQPSADDSIFSPEDVR